MEQKESMLHFYTVTVTCAHLHFN